MSIFSPIVKLAGTIINIVKGKGGNFLDFTAKLVSYLPSIFASISQIIEMKESDGKISTKEKSILIRDALIEFDNVTGKEGLSFFGSETPEQLAVEETALDNFKLFVWYTMLRIHNLPLMTMDEVENYQEMSN